MTYRVFHIIGEMGSVEVFMTGVVLRGYNECETDDQRRAYVAHEAWRRLWDSDAKKMLQNLCDNLGVNRVKQIFVDKIQIEEKTSKFGA